MKINYLGVIVTFLLAINYSGFSQHSEISNINNNIKLQWEYTGIGNGYSSPAIAADKIFVTGETDSTGYLFAFNLKGRLLWKKKYGKEWKRRYEGTRAAPTLSGDFVYICSGLGKITCFESENGEIVWTVDMIKDFDGKNTMFGYSMSVVISRDLLFCSPGGDINNVLALNKNTGKIKWTSKGNGEIAGYATPIIVKFPEREILVTFSELALNCFDTHTGEILWTHKLDDFGQVPCNSPLYLNGYIYYVAGSRNGAVKLQLSDNGSSIKKIWKNLDFDTYFGGFVIVKNHLYGTTESKRNLSSVNIETGKITGTLNLGKGSIVSSKGLIYYYNERGQIAVIKPNNGKPELIKSFKIVKGTREHFAHPIIDNHILYIRHGNALLAYNI